MQATARSRRWIRCVVALALTAVPAVARAQISGEYDLKAQAIYNFLLFTDWPPESFQSASTPIRVCVMGGDPFGTSLEKAIQAGGRQVKGRPIEVVARQASDDVDSCHLLFVARSEREWLTQIAPALANARVLTVGDTEDSVRKGAIIGLYVDRNKLRFEINPTAAGRAGLKISSNLLRVAKVAVNTSED